MGEAKTRGTREQRIAQAIERDERKAAVRRAERARQREEELRRYEEARAQAEQAGKAPPPHPADLRSERLKARALLAGAFGALASMNHYR